MQRLPENSADCSDSLTTGSVAVRTIELPPSAYTVRGRRWLVRLDGQVWPSGWFSVPPMPDQPDPNEFRVSWAYGRIPPLGGKMAAAQFALEIAKRCAGDKTCQLPQRVSNITREGVSYTILDTMQTIADGRTGIATVDLWLLADKRGRQPRPHLYAPYVGATRRD